MNFTGAGTQPSLIKINGTITLTFRKIIRDTLLLRTDYFNFTLRDCLYFASTGWGSEGTSNFSQKMTNRLTKDDGLEGWGAVSSLIFVDQILYGQKVL